MFKLEEDMMGMYHALGRGKVHIGFYSNNLEERHLGDLGIKMMTIIK
jgi:hypothetical protein